MKRKTWWISSSLILASTLLLLGLSITTLFQVERVYTKQAAAIIETLKRQFLHDTVTNQIKRIETERSLHQRRYTDELERVVCLIDQAAMETLEFEGRITRIFSQEGFRIWDILVWNKETGSVVLDSNSLLHDAEQPIDAMNRILSEYQVYYFRSYAPYTVFIGIPQERIEDEVKHFIAEEIHNSEYSENSYIWVNEVVNYEGGDGYAIRRIHPNLRETVGMSLSTSMTDIAGNTPYKTELEGIKKNGEIFFTYFFQKMGSDVISEKLTYAKLYEEYDWIVAMGIHLDDMATYVDKTTSDSASIIRNIVPFFIIAIVALFVIHSIILLLLERQLNRKRARELELQAFNDTLTGCGNRRAGEQRLKQYFIEMKQGAKPPVVALFDIDHFKLINDTYGHDIGDRCLIQLVDALKEVICEKDALYRWGGDEFVIICPSIDQNEVRNKAEELLEVARSITVSVQTMQVRFTISLGISSFTRDDKDELAVLKRSDTALYKSKEQGRDQYTIDL